MSISTIPCERIVPGQEHLTPAQEAYAQQFAQQRIASRLATTTIDEREAEKHLCDAYRIASLEPPKRFRWFDSPVAFIQAHSSIGASIGASIRASIGDSIRASIRASIGASIRASIRASIGASIRASIWASIGASIRASIRASIGDSIGDSIRDSIGDSIRAYMDENWLAFYRFFHEIYTENNLIHLALFNEMVCGYRLGKEEAWLVRKPVRLECDERGRLHSTSGKCIEYRDGWGFYAWHGVRCQEKIIMQPDGLSKDDWMHEQNLEIRRAIQERLGNDRFVELVGGQCLDAGKRGRLIEIDLGSDPERVAHYVHVHDSSTEREYYLRVPPTIRTADEAVAWTFGLDVADYQPVQET